jgi:ubiquinone/menaquinone biosynthesis C-methylase UbiE
MTIIKQSWSAFSRDIAKIYLDGYGHPSERSKALSAAVLREIFGNAEFRLADFGCGNGHLCDYYKANGLSLQYSGYDFSLSLLAAGRDRYQHDQSARFIEADIEDPNLSGEPCDVVLFSHVLEMLQSPQRGLLAARRLAPMVMIRFFEPPVGEQDIAELLQMEVGTGQTVPYIRRTMSRGYYNLLLDAVGCRSVDVHRAEGDKDQIHVLRF